VATEDDILKQAAEHFKQSRLEPRDEEASRPEEAEARSRRELNEKEVRIIGVYEYQNGGAFVLLRDARARNLPIWIGQDQMMSIALAVEGGAAVRPMTHDLAKLLVERLGGSIDYVLVDDLHNNVYYAKLCLRQGDKSQEIDCRPSDAIAMALRFKAPVYVADHVLEAGNWPEPIEE
jgi:bifunctional DNase/RNase